MAFSLTSRLPHRYQWQRFVNLSFFLRSYIKSLIGLPNPKVFVIGRNKTGTTSLMKALSDLGYKMGYQRQAELLMEDWAKRDFRRLIRYCHKSDAFQDVPFSHHYTFQAMDAAFPKSKFILSIRGSSDEWYQSLIRYRIKLFEKRTGEKRMPTIEEYKCDPYIYEGYLWRNRQLIGVAMDSSDVYPEENYKAHYQRHNELVIDYFRHRPEDLLVINLADPDSMQKLCHFLGKPYDGRLMPKLNEST
jgi:hypothetical protein